ncbi:MOB kinase activator 3A isoform X2 [Monodon monoceros]|uniref:MOB kinase activator 3A n=1 Tax=Monodon monoceros TaxID=40151 RepID=A0A8C6AR45_MONMO|nr:MOB kinase activator 3A isoform X2 [Monodon monoceros]
MSNPFLKQVFNKDKTFRPKRKFEPGTQRFELHKKAQASLNAGLDLKLAVQLPAGEELNDWVAVHVVDFFNRVNLIYGTISDGCTERSCPVMSGGPKYEYRWQDEHRFRRPTALSAPRYMDLLMDWIEVQINNEDVFPTNVEVDPWSRWALSTCNRRSQALPADGIPVPSAVTPTRTRRREQDGSWKGARSWERLSCLPRASTVPGPFPGVSRRVGSSSTSHLGRAVPHLTADAIP